MSEQPAKPRKKAAPKVARLPKGTGKRKENVLDQIAHEQARGLLTEYIEYLQNRRRLLLTNFLAGVMRGMGFAVGFSILGAIVVVAVQKLALANLPGIGDFFAEVVRMVQMRLY